MYKLCTALYRPDSSDRIRARAMLCHIFHLALHDEWYRARDMMLMSHLQETISHSDISTQILHNRTMVQLGLCAFRKGLIWDAHSALHDVWTGGRDFFPQGRVRELLAQGLAHNRYQEKTQEDIKIERRRQVGPALWLCVCVGGGSLSTHPPPPTVSCCCFPFPDPLPHAHQYRHD